MTASYIKSTLSKPFKGQIECPPNCIFADSADSDLSVLECQMSTASALNLPHQAFAGARHKVENQEDTEFAVSILLCMKTVLPFFFLTDITVDDELVDQKSGQASFHDKQITSPSSTAYRSHGR